MQDEEYDYLSRRAAEELDRAEQANDPTVEHVHRQMAVLYAEKIAALRRTNDNDRARSDDGSRVASPAPTSAQSSTSAR